MDVELFNFDLPEERIALRPVSPRDRSKLLQVNGREISDHLACDLPSILRKGDVLVLNNTKVLNAHLQGVRKARAHGGGGDVKIGVNLHKKVDGETWRAFVRPAKRLKIDDIIYFKGDLTARVSDKIAGGDVGLVFNMTGQKLDAAIEKAGEMPLPPYIGKHRDVDAQDDHDYQTVFADPIGSVAAPTAGLHFTPDLLEKLENVGVDIVYITLHVGAGTFLPVSHADTKDHKMHAEWYDISETVADHINQAKANGRRVIAVGTTALRALESSARHNGEIIAQACETDIFITPGSEFAIVDGLLTNFHLPKSTLFMLVSALSGLENMQTAYAYAIQNNYRFYSYGDTSLLWRHHGRI
jgi:S-adenosylmethionine:tRNA ribosyltransferase-isomerase